MHDARLENWYRIGENLYGEVWNDRLCRWKDGHPIRTSTLTKNQTIGEGNLIFTRNSIYLLGEPQNAKTNRK